MSAVNRKLGHNATPAWQVLLFAGMGSIGFLIILAFGDFVYKHTLDHRAYSDLIWIGTMLAGLITAVYFYRLLAQGYHLGIEFFRGLQWYHWLWAGIFISGLVFRKRTAAEGMAAPVDSAAVFRIGVVGAVGTVLLVKLFLRRAEWLRSAFTGIIGLLLWFDMIALLSTIWSVYWQWTFYRAVEYGVDVCMLAAAVYVIKTTADYKRFFDWTWFLYGIMLLNVWFGCVWDPKDALLKSGIFGDQGIGGLGVWLQGVIPDVSSNQTRRICGLCHHGRALSAVAIEPKAREHVLVPVRVRRQLRDRDLRADALRGRWRWHRRVLWSTCYRAASFRAQ